MILLSRSRGCLKDCIILKNRTHRSSEITTPLEAKYSHRPKRNRHTVRAKFARIKQITVHRKKFSFRDIPSFDEGLLRQQSLFMWPGKLRTIRFEFSGPSVQAVLDKLPTAKIIDRSSSGAYLIEAEVYGDGIKMWLLSQGAWVKVVAPQNLVDEIKEEIQRIAERYM